MTSYSKPIEIRWSDLDPNFHLRHSVYYDFGAYVRMCFLTENGLTTSVLAQQQLGPILFREECIFKKEIHFNDSISINLVLQQCTHTYSRWTMQHEIIKNGDIVSAIMTADGAWMDTAKRKLTAPAAIVTPAFDQLPRSQDFKWMEKNP